MSGLAHLGVHYETPDELAVVVVPHVRAALDGGQAVYAVVDDDVVSALRARLGSAAGRVRFQPTAGSYGVSPETFVSRLSSWCVPDHRTLVVGQYSVVEAGEAECALREDGVNLILGDQPLTLVCALSPSDGRGRAATARRSHPGWVTARATDRNPYFRPPADRSPSPAGMWGRLVLTAAFCGHADLARVRNQVIELVCELGLRGSDVDAAVLAVHEAAALVCRTGEEDGASGGYDDARRLIEVRATDTSLFSEVRAPGPVTADRHFDAHTVLGSTVSESDQLRPLTWFSHRVSVHDHDRTRTVRVVVDRRWPPAYRLA